jgi:hypothetical protein
MVSSNIPENKPPHVNIIDHICSLYKRETLDEIRLMEKLKVKIQRRIEDLEFLKNCIDKKVLQKFVCIEHKMRNKWNNTTFCKSGFSIVNREIRRTRYALDNRSKTMLKLHLKLANTIRPELWKTIDVLATLKVDKENCVVRTRQKIKLDKLINKNNIKNNVNNNNTNMKKVVNLSSHEMDKVELSILEKGFNFTISPTSIPLENIICCIEDSKKNLANKVKDRIRQDFYIIMRRSKPQKRNFSKEEYQTLRNLMNNANLAIV